MMDTGIIILAAGNSSRLGEPKQLLSFQGKTLVRNVVEEALKTTAYVLLVTGSNHSRISEEIKDLNVKVIENKKWIEGMGSSINVGITELLRSFPSIKNCIISVCDQPFLNASVFSELIQIQKETEKGIIASKYSETIGTPVLFTEKYFKPLQSLAGEQGAKKMIENYKDDIAEISFEMGAIDIDTQADYKNLIQ